MKDVDIEITITGVTPLLCNRFDDVESGGSTSATFVGDKGTPKEQAEKKLYLDEDGTHVIPQPNVMRCIIDGGKYFKAGKSKVTTLKSSIIPACVDVHGVTIPIESKEGWAVDTRPVRIPSTGGRILAHRPCFNDWALAFTLTLDAELMDAKLLRQIIDASGKRVGLGDFRPDCKGPFGKFVVTRWTEEESQRYQAAA